MFIIKVTVFITYKSASQQPEPTDTKPPLWGLGHNETYVFKREIMCFPHNLSHFRPP